MIGRTAKASALVILGLLLFLRAPALADIYRYLDKDGVWHFTNIKTDARYKLYIKTPPRRTLTETIKDYDVLIRQASDRFGVDPLLVKAVVKAESDFKEKAVSPKGAQGLMQLMPETAKELEVKDSFDAAENIFGGTNYLAAMLKRFNGDKTLALAAYNAGPERVKANNGMPPIPETEAFVKRVLDYYNSLLAAGR
jgi:soluble lytic murein transglycosylase